MGIRFRFSSSDVAQISTLVGWEVIASFFCPSEAIIVGQPVEDNRSMEGAI